MTDGNSGEFVPYPLHNDDDSKTVVSLLNQILERKGWGRQYSTINLTPSGPEIMEPDVIITLHTAGLSHNIGPLQSVYHTGQLGSKTQQQFIYDGYMEALHGATIDSETNKEFGTYTTPSLREETKQRLEKQHLPSIIITFGQSAHSVTGIYMFFSQQYSPQEALDILKTHVTSESLVSSPPKYPPSGASNLPSDKLQ